MSNACGATSMDTTVEIVPVWHSTKRTWTQRGQRRATTHLTCPQRAPAGRVVVSILLRTTTMKSSKESPETTWRQTLSPLKKLILETGKVLRTLKRSAMMRTTMMAKTGEKMRYIAEYATLHCTTTFVNVKNLHPSRRHTTH